MYEVLPSKVFVNYITQIYSRSSQEPLPNYIFIARENIFYLCYFEGQYECISLHAYILEVFVLKRTLI